MKAKDSKSEVLTRLLEVARLIRRRGTPSEAEAVIPFERQFEHDLAERQKELAKQPELIAEPEPAHA